MAEASPNKFHNKGNKFITANDKFTAKELEDYISESILKEDFLPNTKFIMLAGVHHSKNKDGKVDLGRTNYKLLEGYEHDVFSNLYELRDATDNLIWDKMKFDDELITLASEEKLDMKTFVCTYHLSEFSKRKLTRLNIELLKETRPVCIIFASSFSHKSPIIDVLETEGVLITLEGIYDQEKIRKGPSTSTDQSTFELDENFRGILSSDRQIKATGVANKFHKSLKERLKLKFSKVMKIKNKRETKEVLGKGLKMEKGEIMDSDPPTLELDEEFRGLLSSSRTIKDTSVSDKFHNENSNFITATVEINANQLETHLKERIQNGDFFPNTKFVVVAGSHHGVNSDREVVPGMTDYTLLQGFEYKVFNNLYKLKDADGNSVWEKMNFSYELVTMACLKVNGDEYELSKRSEQKLSNLAKDLCDQINPICVIFASCHSFQSPIKDFLIEKGVLAAIDISKDRGEISGGRIFSFDEDQKELNDILREYPTKSLILWGSSGTGKTLALVAALKRKVSYYKRRKIPYKVLVCSFGTDYDTCKELLNDLKTKYGLQTILEKCGTEPMLLKQLEDDLKKYGFNYDFYDAATETLKSLIEAIRKKRKEESLNCKWLIFLDEVVINHGRSDFSALNLDDDDNIELVVAVNPGGIRGAYIIVPPQDNKFITKRFTFKHRNSLEISVFLAHLKKLTREKNLYYQPIDENEDKELKESCFPAIDKNFVERRIPVWILAKKDLEDVKILETIKQNHLLPIDETVVLLLDCRNYDSDEEQFFTLASWCKEQNWKLVHRNEIMGSEASVVILYNCDEQTELYSRAKNCLIIVHKFGEDDFAAPYLRKMSKHEVEENCEVCQQEESKSSSLKISRTKILERVILPSNECWMCDLKFEDSESQVHHFAELHECDFCRGYFNNSSERRKHYLEKHKLHVRT